MSEEITEKPESNLATKQIIEGLLLAAGKPLPMSKIAEVFDEQERPDAEALKAVLEEIEEDCKDRGFELKKVASGYRFQVKQEYGEWVGKLWEEKPQRYSRALLETISIIAYRQPITRGEIEKIRGVAVSTNIIRTLIEREWVRVVGHRDVPGRPAMYATSKEFLDYFNLKSLEELPTLSEIRDLEELDPELSLEDDKPESRVLEFPSAEEMEDPFDVPSEEEERAAAIGTRPIEEILGINDEPEQLEQDWDDDDEELSTASVEESSESQMQADAADSEAGNSEEDAPVNEEDNSEDTHDNVTDTDDEDVDFSEEAESSENIDQEEGQEQPRQE